MTQYARLTEDQLVTLGVSTYRGEVILIDYEKTPVTHESFYWNAQEFFSESELQQMPQFSSELFENKC